MKAFLIMILVMGGLLHARPEYLYEVEVANSDSLDVVTQKKRMNSFFTDREIDWSKGLFYLFIDKDEVFRLFVYSGGDSLDLFQMPLAKTPRWLNPLGYMEEMRVLKSTANKDVCHQKVKIEESLGEEIFLMGLEHFPMVRKKKQRPHFFADYTYNPSYNKIFYCGYVKRENRLKYFRFIDFRQEENKPQYPLNKFINIFEKLEHYPFIIKLEGCR